MAAYFLAGALCADAQIITLKDGSFVDGKIIRQNSRAVHVQTRFGLRTYSKRDEVKEILEAESPRPPDLSVAFDQLPVAWQGVLNAEADLKLGLVEKARTRLVALRDTNVDPAARRRIEWLLIEVYERMGDWTRASTLLEEKKRDGLPAERIRAEAHLSLFKANPQYKLEYVNEKHARHFLKDEELRLRAQEPDALKDPVLMRLALEEFCEQLLVEDAVSVKSFAKKLDLDATADAIKKLRRVGNVGLSLPYIKDLKRAEGSLVKAQAVLGDYGQAFELDLARTELNHLERVIRRLFVELIAADPEGFQVGIDTRTGKFTPQGRIAWRKRCETFVKLAEPIHRILKYMADRISYYPDSLYDLKTAVDVTQDFLDNAIRTVKRARERDGI